MSGCSIGAVDADMSTLTGESLPVSRNASARDTHVRLLWHARELLFTGTTRVPGTATEVVFATGAHTEVGSSRAGASGCAVRRARWSARPAGLRG